MKYAKRLIYIGTDVEFLDVVLDFFKLHDSEVNVVSKAYESGVLVNSFTESPYHVVLIDFTWLESTSEILEEIRYLKRVESAAGILFCVLFKDEQHRKMFPYVYSLGFGLSFIKGCEIDVFLRDVSYISFSQNIAFPSFAKAKNLFSKLDIGLSSSISEMTEDFFTIDTDFETSTSEVFTQLPMFQDLECKSFTVKEKKNVAKDYPMVNSYELEYPYASPWGDETSENLSRSTVETWIGLNTESSASAQMDIFIFTNDLKIIETLFSKKNKSLFQINFFNDFSESLNDLVLLKKPAIIFFEYSSVENTNMDQLTLLVSSIKSVPDYFPFLVVTNNQSESVSFQKALMFNFILASKDSLSVEIFTALTETFLKKRGNIKTIENVHRFKLDDPMRIIDINFSILVSSITEHEVTFYSKSILPSFAILHFFRPIEFYATVVPTKEELKAKEEYYHYKSIIHGLSENELMMLRQFVNQVIYDPKTSFEEVVIENNIIDNQDEVAKKESLVEVDKIELRPKAKENIQGLKEISGALKIKFK